MAAIFEGSVSTVGSEFCAGMLTAMKPTLAAVFSILTLAAPAAADIPPPDDYVETCTLARYEAAGGDCLACPGGWDSDGCADHPDVTEEHERCCSSWGASSNTEVWCAGGCPSVGEEEAEPEPEPEPEPEADAPTNAPGADGGCGCRVAASRSGLPVALGALGLLALIRRPGRRRR